MGKGQIHDLTDNEAEKVILVGVISQNQSVEEVTEYLE